MTVAINSNIDEKNLRTNKKNNTQKPRKQKWEVKQLYLYFKR